MEEKPKISVFIERKIKEAKKTAEKNGAKFICAEFKNLKTFNNVLVRIPDMKDIYLKKMAAFKAVTLNNQYSETYIPTYYRRGTLVDGVFITNNYFSPHSFGGKVLASVTVVKKIDYHQGKECIVLDIKVSEAPLQSATHVLKIGTLNGEFLIPDTKKFIQFKKINKFEVIKRA